MIRLDQLGVTFHPGTALQHQALRQVSLTIPEGGFVTLIGSNGAGKSTLLNLLSGEIAATSGAIWIDDTNVTGLPAHQRAGMVARVFQDPRAGTCGDLSIEQNMALAITRGKSRGMGFALHHSTRRQIRDRLAQLGLGLEDRMSDQIGLLSGGQRQAISLVMATLSGSKILLLDEHTAALDPRMAAFVLQLTDTIYSELQPTILMVTHSMRQALAHGNRTIMLHQGEVVLDLEGEDRRDTTIESLLAMFHQARSEKLEEDALLLS